MMAPKPDAHKENEAQGGGLFKAFMQMEVHLSEGHMAHSYHHEHEDEHEEKPASAPTPGHERRRVNQDNFEWILQNEDDLPTGCFDENLNAVEGCECHVDCLACGPARISEHITGEFGKTDPQLLCLICTDEHKEPQELGGAGVLIGEDGDQWPMGLCIGNGGLIR